MSHQEVFRAIYEQRAWGSEETVSGPGSTLDRAEAFRGDVIALLGRLQTRVLLDAGCGDFHWMAPVADSVEAYIGIDVVPELVAETRRQFAQVGRDFRCLDITKDPLPRADVVLCRDCLVHFSLADIRATLRNLAENGSTYLLTTTFEDTENNREIETGSWRPLNLERPPFSFPPPLATVDERCGHSEGQYRSKRFALWRLAGLTL